MQLVSFENYFIKNMEKYNPLGGIWGTEKSLNEPSPSAGEIWRIREEDQEQSALVLVTVAEENEYRGVLVSDTTWFAGPKDLILRSKESPLGLDLIICTWCDISISHSFFFSKVVEVSDNVYNAVLLLLQRNLDLPWSGDIPLTFLHSIRSTFYHTAYQEKESDEIDCDYLPLPILQGVISEPLDCVNPLRVDVCLGPLILEVNDCRIRIQQHLFKELAKYS